MKKIAFIGHDLKFVQHIIDSLKDTHEIKVDEWNGHEEHDVQKSKEIVEWADILFCEWGLGNVVWYQEHKKEHQKLFARLHRFEMNTKYPSMFDYSKIDKLIAISPYIFEEFHRVAKVPREKMTVIYNAVDTDRFNKPKNTGTEFNIGIIGIVPMLKRLDRALDIFEKLLEKDSRYKLFIKGKHPKEYGWVWNNDEQREQYEKAFKRIKKYKDNVFFEGWGDVSEWLQNIGFVLSVSDYESFHMAPIEGMASGAYPVVLKREGVNTVFPSEFIHQSTEECVEFINSHQTQPSVNLADFVVNNYSLGYVCNELEKLFTVDTSIERNTLTILGSCVTRDAFEFEKDKYDIDHYFARTSLVSLTSPPIEVNEDAIHIDSKFQRRSIYKDLTKTFFNEIKEMKSNFIVIDLIDERFDLLKVDDSYITNSQELRASGYNEYLKPDLIKRDVEQFDLWKRAADVFFEKLFQVFNPSEVILHKTLWSERYLEKDKKENTFKNNIYEIKRHNKLLSMYYDYIERKHHHINVIDMTKTNFVSSENHKWGLSPYHFEDKYYLNFLDSLEEIIKK